MGRLRIKRVQVPNSMIVDKEINHADFALYVELKDGAYNNIANVYIPTLLGGLRWTQRKLKAHIESLCERGYIINQVGRLNPYQQLQIELKPMEGYFTQVDIHTIKKIKECTPSIKITGKKNPLDVYDTAIRLFYYYEKNYNSAYGKAFPSYSKITEDTKIHSTYIKAINSTFHENGIVKVMQGNSYDKDLGDGILVPHKPVNEYIPFCHR